MPVLQVDDDPEPSFDPRNYEAKEASDEENVRVVLCEGGLGRSELRCPSCAEIVETLGRRVGA